MKHSLAAKGLSERFRPLRATGQPEFPLSSGAGRAGREEQKR